MSNPLTSELTSAYPSQSMLMSEIFDAKADFSRLTSNNSKVLMIFLRLWSLRKQPLRIRDALFDRALSMESHLRQQSHWTIALCCINVQCVSCRHAWQFIKLILIKKKDWGFTVTRQWRLIYEIVQHGKYEKCSFFRSPYRRSLSRTVEAIGRKITQLHN